MTSLARVTLNCYAPALPAARLKRRGRTVAGSLLLNLASPEARYTEAIRHADISAVYQADVRGLPIRRFKRVSLEEV